MNNHIEKRIHYSIPQAEYFDCFNAVGAPSEFQNWNLNPCSRSWLAVPIIVDCGHIPRAPLCILLSLDTLIERSLLWATESENPCAAACVL